VQRLFPARVLFAGNVKRVNYFNVGNILRKYYLHFIQYSAINDIYINEENLFISSGFHVFIFQIIFRRVFCLIGW
jgi:hypothetical protein